MMKLTLVLYIQHLSTSNRLLHPSYGFNSYFRNHWAWSTNQPLC